MEEQEGIAVVIEQTDDAGEQDQGRPRKPRLMTHEYIKLYKRWGFDLRLNLCNDDVELNGERLSDIHESHIIAKVRDYGIAQNLSTNVKHAREAMDVAAARAAYHPIKNYLTTLRWDGRDHLGDLCTYFVETPDSKGLFLQWFGHWLVGAVAKVFEGYQNPMLVLDGAQDLGKSHFVRWLCPLERYHQEAPIFPDSKDCRMRLWDTWIWEVMELGSTTKRTDLEALKAFLTMVRYRERKSYGHRDIDKPTMASFVGTINNDAGFLIDRTGNRRFLVCSLDKIHWDYAEQVDVGQLWAQAVDMYREGEAWKLTDAEKSERDESNDAYMVDDPVEAMLGELLEYTGEPGDTVALPAILRLLRDNGSTVNQKSQSMTIASVLTSWGALKKRASVGGKRMTVYYGVKAA